MSFTSMHNDYLDPDIHSQQQEDYTVDIEELKKELKEYDTGRWEWDKIDCCMTGKDADLEPWGDQGIEIVSADDGGVKCRAHILKTVAGEDVSLNVEGYPDDNEYDRILQLYLEQAQEVVAGCGVAGEWDGDGWVFSDSVDYEVPWVFPEDSDVPDYKKTATTIVAGAEHALSFFEDELRMMDQILDVLAGWKDLEDHSCHPGKPSPAAAWLAGKVEEERG